MVFFPPQFNLVIHLNFMYLSCKCALFAKEKLRTQWNKQLFH